MKEQKALIYKSVLCTVAFSLFVLLEILTSLTANAQALPTATGPGTYVTVGGTVSVVQPDYGRTLIRGDAIFVDVNPYWHSGIEVEARRSYYPHFGERQSTLLAGPRWSARTGRFIPYAKFLAGGGQFNFPYGYGVGRYVVIAPGAGLDVNLGRRIKVRTIDFEYQIWPDFSFGTLKPYSFNSGISIQVWGLKGMRLAR